MPKAYRGLLEEPLELGLLWEVLILGAVATISPKSPLFLGECPMALSTAFHRARQGGTSRPLADIQELLSSLGRVSVPLGEQRWPQGCCSRQPLPTLLHSWGDSAQHSCQVQGSREWGKAGNGPRVLWREKSPEWEGGDSPLTSSITFQCTRQLERGGNTLP